MDMNFFKAAMFSRRYGLPFEYNVRVVDAYCVLADKRVNGWTVIAKIVVDGEETIAMHWYDHMRKDQATRLVAAVKRADVFDAGMWQHV